LRTYINVARRTNSVLHCRNINASVSSFEYRVWRLDQWTE